MECVDVDSSTMLVFYLLDEPIASPGLVMRKILRVR